MHLIAFSNSICQVLVSGSLLLLAPAPLRQAYLNFTGFPFPLGPLFARRTVRTQVDERIWTFEQEPPPRFCFKFRSCLILPARTVSVAMSISHDSSTAVVMMMSA